MGKGRPHPTQHQRQIKQSDFEPPWWANNRHVQTIWPRFFQKRKKVSTRNERLELPDGDFVDLTWTHADQPAFKPKGLVVMFHGLEGSAKSHYANDMLATMVEFGWQTVLMHFRGCSGVINRTSRAYHSGDTEDSVHFLDWLDKRFPGVPKVGMGFSLGANMLLKLLGERPKQPWLKAAVAISPPFKLEECASSISQGFSKVYQSYLLKSMRNTLRTKMQQLKGQTFPLAEEAVDEISSFREFDEKVTAPLHGFGGADDYYQRCSAVRFTKHIETPTLVIHSLDDPFMNHTVVPSEDELSSAVQLELSSKGGHVGFMQGSPWNPRIWLHERVPAFVRQFLPEV